MMISQENPDYSTVTEVTGYNVSKNQLERIYTRYKFAGEFCRGKSVLEVACGSGQGVGFLAKEAEKVVGVDIDEKLLAIARNCYQGRKNIEIRKTDAQRLDFEEDCFDVVILYEAIYYLPDPGKFIEQARRVLKKDGILIVCSANKEVLDFNPSPQSHCYFSAKELYYFFEQNGFRDISLRGDCSIVAMSVVDKCTLVIKKIAVAFHLIPKTMKGKEVFKRIFFGKLLPMPAEIHDGLADYTAPEPISYERPVRNYKVIFAIGYNTK